VLLSRLALNFVVHESCNIVLETGPQFVDRSEVCSFGYLSLKCIVGLDDLLISIGEVIFTSHSVCHGD
jgi:hypothetical protein